MTYGRLLILWRDRFYEWSLIKKEMRRMRARVCPIKLYVPLNARANFAWRSMEKRDALVCRNCVRWYSLFLSLSKMWTAPRDGLRRRARLMKSCARQRHKAAALQLSNFCQRCGWQTHGVCGVTRNFSTTYICGELYALNFFGTFRTDRSVVRSIFCAASFTSM